MVNYQESFIYKLCCKDPEITDIYIGSTTNFSRRKNEHKSVCCKPESINYNLCVYTFIRENGGWDNFDMVLIEKYSCESKLELHARERFWIEELNATLNYIVPTRTQKERYETNREQILEKQKIYNENNRGRIANYKKEYQQINSQKLSEKSRLYYMNNKAQVTETVRKYRESHKQEISEKKKQKMECPVCKVMITKDHFKRHEHSVAHQNNLSKQNPEIVADPNINKTYCNCCDVYISEGHFKRHEQTKKHQSNLSLQSHNSDSE